MFLTTRRDVKLRPRESLNILRFITSGRNKWVLSARKDEP